MIVVSYFVGHDRAGMFAWRERPDGSLQALGGKVEAGGGGPHDLTAVQTDAGDRILRGHVHPDHLREIAGRDAPHVVELEFVPAEQDFRAAAE